MTPQEAFLIGRYTDDSLLHAEFKKRIFDYLDEQILNAKRVHGEATIKAFLSEMQIEFCLENFGHTYNGFKVEYIEK